MRTEIWYQTDATKTRPLVGKGSGESFVVVIEYAREKAYCYIYLMVNKGGSKNFGRGVNVCGGAGDSLADFISFNLNFP